MVMLNHSTQWNCFTRSRYPFSRRYSLWHCHASRYNDLCFIPTKKVRHIQSHWMTINTENLHFIDAFCLNNWLYGKWSHNWCMTTYKAHEQKKFPKKALVMRRVRLINTVNIIPMPSRMDRFGRMISFELIKKISPRYIWFVGTKTLHNSSSPSSFCIYMNKKNTIKYW